MRSYSARFTAERKAYAARLANAGAEIDVVAVADSAAPGKEAYAGACIPLRPANDLSVLGGVAATPSTAVRFGGPCMDVRPPLTFAGPCVGFTGPCVDFRPPLTFAGPCVGFAGPCVRFAGSPLLS